MAMYSDRPIPPLSGTSTSTPRPSLAKLVSLAQIGDPTRPENQAIFRMWFIDNIVPLVGGEAATILRKVLESKVGEPFLERALRFQINLELGILNEADAEAALKARQENAEDLFPGAREEAQVKEVVNLQRLSDDQLRAIMAAKKRDGAPLKH